MNHNQTLKKEERLCSKSLLESVFRNGKSINEPPFRLLWQIIPLPVEYPVQIAVTVSKRNFKSAVKRNRIKRIMREAYRKNKEILFKYLKERNLQCVMVLIYTGRDLPQYKEAEQKIILTLQRFITTHEKSFGTGNDPGN